MRAVSIVRIEEPANPARPPAKNSRPPSSAIFALGFRPFYLLAAAWSALAILAWVLMLSGRLPAPVAHAGIEWHAHEMVFGFALAVISGFLLTAVRAWTGIPTPTGAWLAALAVLWIAGRVAVWIGSPVVAASVDGAFAFAVAFAIGRVLVIAGNRRNYFVIAMLCAMGALNLAFHFGAGLAAVKAALYLVLVLVAVMGGRVIPSFTQNGLPRVQVVRRPWLDKASIALALAAFAADALSLPGPVVAPLAGAAALAHAARLADWKPIATLRTPILWILHLSYAWIAVGFALLSASALGFLAPGAATHAFAAGAMGGVIIGMITRTALGHTGRPLKVGRSETAAYVLVQLACVLRVTAALMPEFGYMRLIEASAACWAVAFLVYVATYAPRLWKPRADGKPG